MFINIDFDTVVRWLIPLGIILFGLLLGLLIERLLIRTLMRISKKTKWRWDDLIAEACHHSIAGLIFVIGIWIATVYAPLTTNWESTIITALTALATLIATIFIARLASGFLNLGLDKLGKEIGSASLISKTLKVIIIAVGVLFILNNYYEVQIGPLFAALGIGGLAAALALQDTLSNLFSGFQIIGTRQVRPGDYIRIEGGELGKVIDVSWRNVTILSHPDENLIIIPNSKLATNTMINYNLPRRMLMEVVEVGVSYNSDLQQVEKVTLEVAEETIAAVSGKNVTIKPQVRFRQFDDFSINFQVRLFLPQLKGRAVYKSEFIKNLHERFKKEGIEIPFPIRNVFLKKDSEGND